MHRNGVIRFGKDIYQNQGDELIERIKETIGR